MDVQITPSPLHGTIRVPPSKSASHRAVICAALSRGTCRIAPVSFSKDIEATLSCARALGAQIQRETDAVRITGIGNIPQAAALDCEESGSTLRFFLPIAAALGIPASFSGKGKLPDRPLEPLAAQMRAHGVCFSPAPALPFSISGRLAPGRFSLAGNVSSQFITGLLFALPLLEGDSEILLVSPLESAGYVEMTLEMLRHFGIRILPTEHGWTIPGGQAYRPADITVEADYSNAAFWLAAGALGDGLNVQGLREPSAQGDREILPLLRRFGALVCPGENGIFVSDQSLRGIIIDAAQIPDLVPILAVLAAYSEGKTMIQNAGRLRLKECDRLAAVSDLLDRLGAQVEERPDSLVICGSPSLPGGVTVNGWGDHRIVMSAAVAALRCERPVTITGAQAVQKSYPSFFEDFQALGGICHVL